jgi:hypothetical protein
MERGTRIAFFYGRGGGHKKIISTVQRVEFVGDGM